MGLGRVIFLYVAQSTTNDIPNRSMSGIRVTLKFSTQPCENLGACPWLVHAHTRHLPSKGDNDLSIFYGKGGEEIILIISYSWLYIDLEQLKSEATPLFMPMATSELSFFPCFLFCEHAKNFWGLRGKSIMDYHTSNLRSFPWCLYKIDIKIYDWHKLKYLMNTICLCTSKIYPFLAQSQLETCSLSFSTRFYFKRINNALTM